MVVVAAYWWLERSGVVVARNLCGRTFISVGHQLDVFFVSLMCIYAIKFHSQFAGQLQYRNIAISRYHCDINIVS